MGRAVVAQFNMRRRAVNQFRHEDVVIVAFGGTRIMRLRYEGVVTVVLGGTRILDYDTRVW